MDVAENGKSPPNSKFNGKMMIIHGIFGNIF
jgi:hypothetical protein